MASACALRTETRTKGMGLVSLAGWALYTLYVLSAVSGIGISIMNYSSNLSRYQRELDHAREFIKGQCSDGHEVLKWDRGPKCAQMQLVVTGDTPEERARMDFLRSFTWCEGLDDCKERYGWAFQSFYMLLSKAILAATVVGVCAFVVIVMFGQRARGLVAERLSLPTTHQQCKQD